MDVHALAGQPVPPSLVINIPRLVTAYYALAPDPGEPAQRVSFGTSGHRGSSLSGTFNEGHVLAVSQAVCNYRAQAGIDGPLFLGRDTHALSECAYTTVLEVMAANGVPVRVAPEGAYTPTPAVSRAIICHNRDGGDGTADGMLVTPSHNPPEDGGVKYNPPHGGPAESTVAGWITAEANRILDDDCRDVRRVRLGSGVEASFEVFDYMTTYVEDLDAVIDMAAVAGAGLHMAADALGGSGMAYWGAIADRYGLDITVMNAVADPTFSFMRVDRDGRVRMDCSSPYAMAGLVDLRHDYDLAFGNDPDFDRHGIVTPAGGLMNPNHMLAVAVHYLFAHRPAWAASLGVGKTLVSSLMVDRVAAALGRHVVEVPVGFKWFVPDLTAGRIGFCGEESAGATFLRRDGTVWTTDKDGIIMALLAAEIQAVTGRGPHEHYNALTATFGEPVYRRVEAPATRAEKEALRDARSEVVHINDVAGDPVEAVVTRAPGNNEPIGGIKVVTRNGWFAVRPSGTEDVYKVYAESFEGDAHLDALERAGSAVVRQLLDGGEA